jgi:hypothetical protein
MSFGTFTYRCISCKIEEDRFVKMHLKDAQDCAACLMHMARIPHPVQTTFTEADPSPRKK